MQHPYLAPRDPFGSDDVVSRPIVGSFDATLMQHLERHLAEEHHLLAEYRALAERSPDAPVRYLASLLVEDEERHHRVLSEMLNQVRTSVWLAEQTPRVPWLTRSRDPELRRTVRRLRAFERDDLRRLRKLRRRLRFLRRDSLNGVLVRALELDTRKHLAYLGTLARVARRK